MKRLEFLRLGFGLGFVTCLGCNGDEGLLLPGRESGALDLDRLTLVARLVHVTDTHIVDTQSPARFAGARVITDSAWRPYESYSTQLFDGIVRSVNRLHASGRTIDFLLHTGDACDNAQGNELAWLIGILDGDMITPLSGPDDRSAEALPEPALDPYADFQAQGLYRTEQHGDLPSIPWYIVFGNHDVYSIGVFPIFEGPDGHRTAPLPLHTRPGFVLPVRLDPVASFAHGNVTPAEPGPPCFLETPRYVEPNPQRAFFNKREFIGALFDTVTPAAGHGFEDHAGGKRWYSVSPVDGVRLIGLDSTDAVTKIPGGFYDEGAVSREQLAFLRRELDAALARDELVIVAMHHPSSALLLISGTEVLTGEFRSVLAAHANVVLYLCGHRHRNRVTQHGGYLEIETCSTLDLPQEGRLIEIWRDESDGTVVVAYEMFSHLDDTLPALDQDPLRALRETARSTALADKEARARQTRSDSSDESPDPTPGDRDAVVILER